MKTFKDIYDDVEQRCKKPLGCENGFIKAKINPEDWLRAWNEGTCTHKITFDEPIRGNGMFNKKKYTAGAKFKEEEIQRLENRFNAIHRKLDKMKDEHRADIKKLRADITEDDDWLNAEIDKLKHPMGRIDKWVYQDYIYGNKRFKIPQRMENITGFRKKGDCVEITWNEYVNETDLKIYTKTFFLKDELIPLDAIVDFGDVEWQEVVME